MQMNYLIAGIEGQGGQKLTKLLTDILFFDGFKVHSLNTLSNANRMGIGIQLGFIRTGEGVFTPFFDEKSSDVIYLLDLSLSELAIRYIKRRYGVILATSTIHNVLRGRESYNKMQLIDKLIRVTKSIYICDVLRLLNEHSLDDSDEFKNWALVFCLLSMGLRLGIIPLKIESYMTSIQSILNNEKLVRLNKRILMHVNNYFKRVGD